ncbi:MAG: hypothetical protein VW600_06790, partial [Ferrovibrio sp.]
LYAVHWLELVVFCVCAWIAGWMIFRRLDAAWLTFLAVVFCRELRETTGQALTETLSYAVSGLFFLSWIYAWRTCRRPAWLLTGVALGLLILAKPAATAIIPTAIVLLAVMLFAKRDGDTHLRVTAGNAAVFVAGAAAVTVPLLLRNYVELGVFALSSPQYLTATFAHRLGYNAMCWTEWLTGWLFYLPDFGDTLARKWLPEATYDRLGWDPQSYYVYGRDVLHQQGERAARTAVNSYLFREYVLAEPVKHAAVTLLLAWRGMFVGKLWGLIAFLLLPAALIGAKQQRMMLALMLAPAVVVLFGQAALSVSIQRYNGLLVLPLALTTTALVVMLWDRWRPHRKAGSRQP